MINYKDVESMIRDFLRKAGYKAPNQIKERGIEEKEVIKQNISDKDLQNTVNGDFMLFLKRFIEFNQQTVQ